MKKNVHRRWDKYAEANGEPNELELHFLNVNESTAEPIIHKTHMLREKKMA